MRRLSAIAAAVAAVAVLGIAAAGASAAGSPTLADDVAARLGIAPEKLRQAFEDAITARIDAAVKAGKLTPQQGANLKERLAVAKGLGLRLRGRLAMKHPALVRGIRARVHRLGPATKYLGITPQELRSERVDAASAAAKPPPLGMCPAAGEDHAAGIRSRGFPLRAARRSASALSVRSQVKSASARPKWPYAAVFR